MSNSFVNMQTNVSRGMFRVLLNTVHY